MHVYVEHRFIVYYKSMMWSQTTDTHTHIRTHTYTQHIHTYYTHKLYGTSYTVHCTTHTHTYRYTHVECEVCITSPLYYVIVVHAVQCIILRNILILLRNSREDDSYAIQICRPTIQLSMMQSENY